MSKGIGIIAEDSSDVDVVTSILEKYSPRNKFYVKRFVGNGCGKLRNKCSIWIETLFKSGCEIVFVFHDLDRNNVSTLRAALLEKIPANKIPKSLIVIPVEELEAWLLSDQDAIQRVFSLKAKPKRYKNCESVKSPKEELEKLIWTISKKRYLNTVHNERIAQQTSLENLRRCQSFLPFDAFLKTEVFVS